MESLPEALEPLVTRLERDGLCSREQLSAVVFIVRLIDSLHASFYATFLSQPLAKKLAHHLEIPDLIVEIDVFKTRWSFRQGAVSVVHTISFDYDCHSINQLTKIGMGVLNDRITPAEGLRLIRVVESGRKFSEGEDLYRDFPGRALVLPFMACTCATVYFEGTWHDLYWSATTGLLCGLIAWGCSVWPQLFGVMDILVAITTAMMTIAAVTAQPESTCFSAQVLGNLYWFLYGTAYVLSVYEIINGQQVLTGMTRFVLAIFRSYVLAFGVVLGTWFAGWNDDREFFIARQCSEATEQMGDRWYILLFSVNAVSCLMQFRVGLRHFLVCFLVQAAAYGLQYSLQNVWEQPEFIANLVPAFAAVVLAQMLYTAAHRMKMMSVLSVSRSYDNNALSKKTDDYENGHDEEADTHNEDDGAFIQNSALTTSTNFVNEGWTSRVGFGGVGYSREDQMELQRSDIWFCVLPALYLLVPGSKLLQISFAELVSGIDDEPVAEVQAADISSFGTALFTIALAQALGLRLGFAFLWLINAGFNWFKECFCRQESPDRIEDTNGTG
jgi:uncharacterized membrane protein YjjP (DUF1212 family)